jgi:hypothetical protein
METIAEFHALAAFLPVKEPRNPLSERLGGPQSWSERGCIEKKHPFPLSCCELNPDHPTRSPGAVLTKLPTPGVQWPELLHVVTNFDEQIHC